VNIENFAITQHMMEIKTMNPALPIMQCKNWLPAIARRFSE